MTKMVGNKCDWFLVADWDDNMTYFMDINWNDGTLKYRREFISVPYPNRLVISEEKIVVMSSGFCCTEESKLLNKLTIYGLSGNLMTEVTHLPTGEKFEEPEAIALDPRGNILLADTVLGTVVLSGDGSSLLATLPIEPAPVKIIFYQAEFSTSMSSNCWRQLSYAEKNQLVASKVPYQGLRNAKSPPRWFFMA